PYFGKDSNTVEGGFYGDKAQELAGKFLADDKSIFVVFAGKRDEKGEDKVEKKFDSVQVSLKDLAKSDMDTFGLATHLVIDGVQIA
ncbi:transferrin-binding protein-like solute binding protein, partial [Mannheimia haemolytica]